MATELRIRGDLRVLPVNENSFIVNQIKSIFLSELVVSETRKNDFSFILKRYSESLNDISGELVDDLVDGLVSGKIVIFDQQANLLEQFCNAVELSFGKRLYEISDEVIENFEAIAVSSSLVIYFIIYCQNLISGTHKLRDYNYFRSNSH